MKKLFTVSLAALLAVSTLTASPNGRNSHSGILMEFVGQVVNGDPTPASSVQYGNLQNVAGIDPALSLTFFTEAVNSTVVNNPPLRIIDRTGTTTIYLANQPGDFTDRNSFRSGSPVQVSSLRQQVIVDTSTGVFTVVNINSIESSSRFDSGDHSMRLGEPGQSSRTALTGHLNAPGLTPTGWFAGYAVPVNASGAN